VLEQLSHTKSLLTIAAIHPKTHTWQQPVPE